ncbi:hypothetical protein, partial [Enterocloster bolteae]|uniref:hypothetical protein n=1 Tax=Enterocloster bolteae TaxID=208479 RepID=UPI002A83623D
LEMTESESVALPFGDSPLLVQYSNTTFAILQYLFYRFHKFNFHILKICTSVRADSEEPALP